MDKIFLPVRENRKSSYGIAKTFTNRAIVSSFINTLLNSFLKKELWTNLVWRIEKWYGNLKKDEKPYQMALHINRRENLKNMRITRFAEIKEPSSHAG